MLAYEVMEIILCCENKIYITLSATSNLVYPEYKSKCFRSI
jgi:hypothetical protein